MVILLVNAHIIGYWWLYKQLMVILVVNDYIYMI